MKITVKKGNSEVHRFYRKPLTMRQSIEVKLNLILFKARIMFKQPTKNDMHYPECWDTIAYPTLESAMSEFGGAPCDAGCACTHSKPEQTLDQAIYASGFALSEMERHIAEWFFKHGNLNTIENKLT